MINNEEEIWRAHPEYTGTEVSTFGRVRTLDRAVPCKGNGTRLVKGQVLKQQLKPKGYLQVGFRVNGKYVSKSVHRLVAQTFIKNPDNLPEINHKDSDPTNNNVSNIEWCSHLYNIQYREKFGKSLGVPVLAVNLKTQKVSRYPSQYEAGRTLGVKQGHINEVIKGKYKQAGGYWFTNDDDNAADTIKQKLYEIKHQATLIMH